MASPSLFRRLAAGTALGLTLLTGACATTGNEQVPAVAAVQSQPTVILVSIDGFRADYLSRGLTPNLSRLAQEGASGPMKPSFPTVTFPNHYTLVTGLHPDHHGIVGNNMIDDELGRFSLGNQAAVTDRRWWDDGEPIWVSAEKAGVKTGTMFWPGSEAAIHGVRPSHWLKFDQSMDGNARVDQLLAWLDLPQAERPRLNTLYFDIVDTMGHHHGPQSDEVNAAMAQTDASIGYLLEGLKARGLDDDTIIIVVSDHGMSATSPDRVVTLDDYVDTSALSIVYSGPVAFLNAGDDRDDEVEKALVGKHERMECWEKDDIPARLVLGSHDRVSDFVCLAQDGWLIATRDRPVRKAGGAHGYDNISPDMQAIFIAYGPGVVAGRRLQNLDSVDVQPLLGRLLNITVPKTDGNPQDTLPVTQP
ncbi:ectonucleotide pyrophosphatase/phosphodiesterase [Brevundimonas sp.]|uniref:alkaline phosphatase family protein n=1 Tax=Brevundimonas sp. TaxID=1871086 RepID=UPI002897DFE8|nr:ectonucleotide pyrophosphatase/phosphodiesterase [Brevundimonas sp.]